MKNQGIKQVIITQCIAAGINFEGSPFELSGRECTILADYAKQVHYRKPRGSYFAIGGAFFLHLQKIYRSDRLLQDDIKALQM